MDIIVNNSECVVKGCNYQDELRSVLSYVDTAIQYEFNKKAKYVAKLTDRIRKSIGADKIQLEATRRRELYLLKGLEDKLTIHLYNDSIFPTGLLPLVIDTLDGLDADYTITDRRKQPKLLTYRFVNKVPFLKDRYYQKDSQQELYKKHRGIFIWPTGTGKSATLSKIVWKLGVDTLVVAPSIDILEMIYDDLIEMFGKGKVAKLNTKSTKLKPINVVNIQALIKLPAKLFNKIDLVIIDEFHHSGADSYLEINRNHLKNCYYRLGLTATYDRPQGDMLALQGVLSNILYEYPLKKAFEDGHLIRPNFKIIGNRNVCTKKAYHKQYKEALVTNCVRNARIASIVEDHKKDSIMILVKQIEHGKALQELIPGSAFVHGKEKGDKRKKIMNNFKSGELKVLIGITSILGEGVNLPIANVLVMAGGGKSNVQVMQNIGRILRPYPGKDYAIVYDFKDIGSSYMEEHAICRRAIYRIY